MGYLIDYGYMGFIDGRYKLFATEDEYLEICRENAQGGNKMNEKKPEGIGIGDIVKYNNKIKGIVVRIFSGYQKRMMVDIMTYKEGPKIFTAYADELTNLGDHLTEMVYILRYLQREG